MRTPEILAKSNGGLQCWQRRESILPAAWFAFAITAQIEVGLEPAMPMGLPVVECPLHYVEIEKPAGPCKLPRARYAGGPLHERASELTANVRRRCRAQRIAARSKSACKSYATARSSRPQ